MILSGRVFGRAGLLAAVFFLLAAGTPLYGRGAGEGNILSDADALIEARDYDEAVTLLSDYIRNNPDGFVGAQSRLQKIIRLREQYNTIAIRLLDALETEPENAEKILALSDQLSAFETSTNSSARRFLEQVRFLAEMNVNRRGLERVLAEGRERLSLGDYTGALETYSSGLSIYQAEFFSSGYGGRAEETARAGLEGLRGNITAFNALLGPFVREARAMASLDARNSGGPGRVEAARQGLSPLMEQLVTLMNNFYAVRKSYDDEFALLQAEHGIVGDRSFLSFAGWLITGPVGQEEGMAGTLKRFWRQYAGAAETAVAGIADRAYDEIYLAVAGGDYAEALGSYDETAMYIAAALEMTREWRDFPGDDGVPVVYTLYDEPVNREQAAAFLTYRAMEQALDCLGRMGDFGNRDTALEADNFPALSSWREGTLDAASAIALETGTRRAYREMGAELRNLETQVDSAELSASNPAVDSAGENPNPENELFAEIPAGTDGAARYLGGVRGLLRDMGGRFRVQAYNSGVRLYTIANGDLETRTAGREAEFAEGSRLIQGVSQEIDGIGLVSARYPAEGLEILAGMSAGLENDIASARALAAQYALEDASDMAAAEMSALNNGARNLLDRLLDLSSRSADLIASARTQVERAASLRYEGDRLFQAAQTALNRNDTTAARSSLSRATEQYQASLAVQESAAVRTTWDTQFVRLDDEIIRMENEVVVRDVRDLLTRARDRYYAGNMDEAEELLVRAQNRWRVTNTTEQTEVEYWLGLVRGALSLQSGRLIAPTAPLFAEMSQLLSDARRGYDEGTRLLAGGSRREGLARFNEAIAKTREIRLMFPMNHDARMLELQVEQQTDLAAFNAAFRQRLNEAVAGTRPGVRSIQSLAELQDLAEINPRYPGIAAIVTQAEIDMGLRPPPPDPAALARSAELTRNAAATINSRNTISYGVAQTQLEEAIRLNPNNSQAQTLLDQVSVLLTGTGRYVVPINVQEQYTRAVQMYNQGNYLQANAIVQRLLLDADNRRSTLIQELKRRIDAVL